MFCLIFWYIRLLCRLSKFPQSSTENFICDEEEEEENEEEGTEEEEEEGKEEEE